MVSVSCKQDIYKQKYHILKCVQNVIILNTNVWYTSKMLMQHHNHEEAPLIIINPDVNTR